MHMHILAVTPTIFKTARMGITCLFLYLPQETGSLPSHADVVVIGGGSIGNSTLYHLGKLGVKAVLLEKDQLTAGTPITNTQYCSRYR